MKTLTRLSAALLLTLSSVSCMGPLPMPPSPMGILPAPMASPVPVLTPAGGVSPGVRSGLATLPATAASFRSDYAPHLADEYRNGWRAGRTDASLGASRDYRRAYAWIGGGWESYFQEGYADGYDGRPMSH